MFPLDAAKRSLLGSTHYNVYVTCAVFRSDGSAVAVNGSYIGNRFLRGSIRASMDDSSRYMTATFDMGLDDESLSPLMGSASANVSAIGLNAGGSFQFGVAVVAPGETPTDGDYELWDIGRIDKWSINATGTEITVEGRDLRSAQLLDRWVELPTKYGTSGGSPVETEMQAIIEDWAQGFGVITLNNGASPGWNITEYAQREQPVLEALRALALQIGWDLRTFPSLSGLVPASGPVFVNVRRGGGGLGTSATFDVVTFPGGAIVMFYDPTRDTLTPDATIDASEYVQISTLSVDDAEVRNVIQVWYRDGADEPLEHIEVTDSASIAQYGRRFMRIVEDTGSNIDTSTEAGTFADAALADLKDPFATHVISLPLWYAVELNDIHEYVANDVHYDSNQVFAVVGYQHEFDKGTGTTTIQARGKPLAAYRAYMEGQPRMQFVATIEPPADRHAPERALWVVTDDLSFPA